MRPCLKINDDDRFAQSGAKIGSSLQIRLPNRYTVSSGAALAVQATTETYATLSITSQAQVGMNFDTADLALSMDDFRERIIVPAMAQLASKVDLDALSMYKNVYNCTGTVQTTPADMNVYLNAGAILDEMACPRDGYRHTVLNPAANAASVYGLRSLFHAGEKIDEQYRKGLMVDSMGMIFSMDQNVNVHTFGTATINSTVTLSATAAEGDTTLALTGLTNAYIFNKGDINTVADCYSVNPENRQSTGRLQNFVITAASSVVSGNAVTVSVSPTIHAAGAYQTVDSLPTSGKGVVIGGAVKGSAAVAGLQSPQNLAFHRDAFVLGTADLELPPGGPSIAARETYDGISMRLWRQGDITNSSVPCRLDVLYGYVCARPELAVRIVG